MSETNGSKAPERLQQIKDAADRRKARKEGATVYPVPLPVPESAADSAPAKSASKTERVRAILQRLGADATHDQVQAELGEKLSSSMFCTQRVILYGRRSASPAKPKTAPKAGKKPPRPSLPVPVRQPKPAVPVRPAAEVLVPLSALGELLRSTRAIGGATVARQVLDALEV